MCNSKSSSGLGVKDLRIFNLVLLSKWRWRILENVSSLWRDISSARYGS